MTARPSLARLSLAPVLDIQAAAALRAELLALRGQDLTLDASGVERLGGLCLQVLMSAVGAWARDGLSLSIREASDAFAQQWALFGAPEMMLQTGETL